MHPIRTAKSNFIYKGPTEDIGDAWVENYSDVVYMVWELTDEERRFIIDGGNLQLGIIGMHPIPPVSLEVVGTQKVEEPEWKYTEAGWQKPLSERGRPWE